MQFYTNVQVYGNRVLVRGSDNGVRFKTRDEFKPTLYLKSKNKTNFKTLNGDYVEPIQPGSIKDCREFYKRYSEVDNFEIYGNERYLYQYISETYPEDEIKYDSSLIKTYIIDIEVESENGFPDVESASEELLLITIKDSTTNKIYTWGKGPYHNPKVKVNYRSFSTEYDLLSDFIHWWSEERNTPDIISGWNSTLYDIPYITRRLDRVLGEKYMNMLSPWGLVRENEVYVSGRKHISYDVVGISQLDYLDLYKKFTYKNQESYRLDYIAEVELGQKKLDHSEFDTFKDFYTKGWNKFVTYNILDVQLVDRLEDKMKLIDLAITMAYDAKVNYEDVFSQVRMWDTIIYNYLKKRNVVIPPKEKTEKDEKFGGAYVKDPNPGMYDYVVSFDLNSLYPHLIMMYNLSPETILEEKHPTVNVDKILNESIDFDLYKDKCVCANGAMFRKDKRGFLPELMEKIYDERVVFKKKMLEEERKLEQIENEMKRRGIL
jgi:DNA polymerase elongation subunit (family B)